MLVVKYTNSRGVEKKVIWHVGKPFPYIDGKVVTFLADGQELDFVVSSLQNKVGNDK